MRTKVFISGNSQAVRIPKELAFDRTDLEFEVERQGDTLLIRPISPALTDVMEVFAAFTSDFMAEGRLPQGEQERPLL